MGLFSFLFGGKSKPQTVDISKPATAEELKKNVPDFSYEQWKAYFEKIFTTEFPGRDFEKDVSAEELVNLTGLSSQPHPACAPVDFLFLKDGKPVVAVVLVRANTYRGMNVKGTHDICLDAGLEYVRFFIDMQNTGDYVANRMKAYLG